MDWVPRLDLFFCREFSQFSAFRLSGLFLHHLPAADFWRFFCHVSAPLSTELLRCRRALPAGLSKMFKKFFFSVLHTISQTPTYSWLCLLLARKRSDGCIRRCAVPVRPCVPA